MPKRLLLVAAAAAAAAAADEAWRRLEGSKPNIVVLFCDDWGWGDLGANGCGAETPHMDALAARGLRLTDMHAGASVCTPSRAALLTGRYGLRTGVITNFWTDAMGGLPQTEHTVADLLRPAGYSSYAIGKWHLGHHVGFHPTYRGFDAYLGLPYSIDMGCMDIPGANLPPDAPCPHDNATTTVLSSASNPSPAMPLYNSTAPNCTGHASCNADIVQQPVDPTTLADFYGQRGAGLIAQHAPGGPKAGVPFFLYVPFTHVHVPLAHDPKWTGASKANTTFADTLLELDNTVGVITAAITAAGLDNNTLIILTGDNGPWSVKCSLAGSSGPFAGAYQAKLGGGATTKLTVWEGGHREPGVVAWPGVVSPGRVSNATVSTLDLLPTFLSLAGVPLPTDRSFDGVSLLPLLTGEAPRVREWLWHPNVWNGNVTAGRVGQYKFYWATDSTDDCKQPAAPIARHDPPLVFDLDADPGESTPVAPGDLPAGLLANITTMTAALLRDIATTLRSTANYTEGGQPAWACCNPDHVVCRCED